MLACAAVACGASDTPASSGSAPTGSAPASGSSGTPYERFLPLVDGTLLHYETEKFTDSPTTGVGIITASVRRTSSTGGDLRLASRTRHIEYAPDGVVMVADGQRSYLIKAPLTVGTTWTGERGAQMAIVGVDLPVTVPAGTYQGCLRTEEARFGDSPGKVLTTYCPDVGIVVLEATNAAGMERASLKHFGPPVDLGPEGVTRTRVNE